MIRPLVVAEVQRDPLVALDPAAQAVEAVAVDLGLDQQPQVRVLGLRERLDDGLQRLAVADEAAREDELDQRPVLTPLGLGVALSLIHI